MSLGLPAPSWEPPVSTEVAISARNPSDAEACRCGGGRFSADRKSERSWLLLCKWFLLWASCELYRNFLPPPISEVLFALRLQSLNWPEVLDHVLYRVDNSQTEKKTQKSDAGSDYPSASCSGMSAGRLWGGTNSCIKTSETQTGSTKRVRAPPWCLLFVVFICVKTSCRCLMLA